MAPQGFLVARGGTSSRGINPVYITGFCVAGALVLAGLVWLGFRTFSKRSKVAKDVVIGAVSKDRSPVNYAVFEKDTLRLPTSLQPAIGQIPLSIPEKAHTRPLAPDHEVVQSGAGAGNSSHPTTPFQLALTIGRQSTLAPTNSGRSFRPSSIFSFTSRRSSAVDVAEDRLSAISVTSSLDQWASCKVCQIFDPVLPDELVLRLGERVTLVQSFDDGWCVVGRPALAKSDDIEIGAVPAWSFLKPLKGHILERPMRLDSLGATNRLDKPATRESIISWSKF